MTLTYSLNEGKESIFIRTNTTNELKYVMLNLKGSFFDNSPEFKLESLLNFLSRFQYTPKQLDVAFNDDKKLLDKKELLRWCRYSDEYCVGSLVRNIPPHKVTRNGKFVRMQLGDAKSKANFGTIYRRPNTKFWRIEIKLKSKHKINHILESYSVENIKTFERRSIQTLVGCINFVSPPSKKTRCLVRYKKQKAWKEFLESDVTKINWNKVRRETIASLSQMDIDTLLWKRANRQAKMLKNLVTESETVGLEEEIIRQLAEATGYKLIKERTGK